MAEENVEVNEEEIISYIYAGCEKLDSGLIETSALIKFIEKASNKIDDEEFHQRLLDHFDGSRQNLSLDVDELRELMTSFIKSAKNEGSFNNNEVDVIEEHSSACSSRTDQSSPNSSTFSSSSISINMSLEQSTKEEDISAKLEHYKSFSIKLSSEKVDLLNRINMAEDHIIQLQMENNALNDSIRNLEVTNESLQQKATDMEEMRSKLIHYQEQWLECEDSICRLEQANQRLKTEAAEARTKVNSILKERDEIEDVNHSLRLKINELMEENSKYEKNLDLYKMMYIQKSSEYEEESMKYKEASEQVESLSTQNHELQLKLTETEEKLRDKELELSAYIQQSSLGSIDEEDLTMKLISKNYKSSFFFKNKPNLCQELQLSLIDSPVFPTPIRDLELQRLLAESSGTDLNSDGSFAPSNLIASHSVHQDEELHDSNTNFLNFKREAFLEGLSNLLTLSDAITVDKKMNSLADEYMSIIQTKISADLGCLNLKTKISEQSEVIESLHQEIFELNEKIANMEDQLSTTKESSEGIKNELEFVQVIEVCKREDAIEEAGLESGIENSSKSSGDSDLKLMEEKDRTIADLESAVSILEADLERQVALNRSIEMEKEQLTEQLKKFFNLEGTEIAQMQLQDHGPVHNQEAQLTNPTIANSEGLMSAQFSRVMASGDSKDVALFAPNHVQPPKVGSNIQEIVRSETKVTNHHTSPRRIPLGRTSSWLWGIIISLVTVALLALREGNFSSLMSAVSSLLPQPELRHTSTPPT